MLLPYLAPATRTRPRLVDYTTRIAFHARDYRVTRTAVAKRLILRTSSVDSAAPFACRERLLRTYVGCLTDPQPLDCLLAVHTTTTACNTSKQLDDITQQRG